MRRRAVWLGLCLLLAAAAVAQGSDPDIQKYITMVNKGQVDEVKRDLPGLLSQYPNNPGVLYLQALTTSEGAEAVRVYQSIVDNFPRSEWADDALYKVYQFYYALGLYRTAEIKMNQLKKDYPDSRYLTSGRPDTREVPDEQPASTARAELHADSVPAVKPPVAPPPARSADPLAVQYVLQVGAYTTQANAEKQKQFFEAAGYSAEIISKEKENRSLFLVWVGSFRSYDEAKAEGARIKQKYNLGSIVISR